MRTDISLAIFVAIGLALLVVQMSGLPGILGLAAPSGYQVDDKVRDLGSEEPEVEGSAIGETPSALSFMASALGTAGDWITGVFLLPVTLDNWLPWYAAYPIGLGLQSLAIFGLIQYAGGPYR